MEDFMTWLQSQIHGGIPPSPAAPQIGGPISIPPMTGGLPVSPAAPQGSTMQQLTPRAPPLSPNAVANPGMAASPAAVTGPRTVEMQRVPPVVNATVGGSETQPTPGVPTAPQVPVTMDSTMGESFLQNGIGGGPQNIIPQGFGGENPGTPANPLLEALKGLKAPAAPVQQRISSPNPEPLYKGDGGLVQLLMGLARNGGGGSGGAPDIKYLSDFLRR